MTYPIFKSFKSFIKNTGYKIKNKFKWCSTCCCSHYKNNRNNSYKILLNDIDTIDTQDTHIISNPYYPNNSNNNYNPSFSFSYPHDIGVNNELYVEYDTNNTQFDDTFY